MLHFRFFNIQNFHKKQLYIIQVLVDEFKVNVNIRDVWLHIYMTPLMKINDNYEAVEFLINNGAEINARDNHGKTALMYDKSELILSLLIQKGAEINARDNDGKTALMHKKKYIEALTLIEKSDFDGLNLRDHRSQTVLLCLINRVDNLEKILKALKFYNALNINDFVGNNLNNNINNINNNNNNNNNNAPQNNQNANNQNNNN